ncbi:PREDICTED: centrosomal protein C10orf90 homolog isoform X1 [Cyprinodon variegatus]|uniref:centrosomal protein C10orf90 homolog isoform X1 n=1 Tax=Cyprinodon variegatus TaxID=28743 RepID=UPI0007427CFC|nr:PREDICTED: centrosomal protein C10orf90 homolog isoform X1 [Cyprinodon variegatus]XP_015231376.1 PREDICTED: centrosomal protein C10orf90 homolog isoform X1 [Cyprinodon variegatus]
MTLRRPAAHRRRAAGWRRSGDESYWDSFISEEEPPRFSRAPRPQSAIEGGQLDVWLEHLRTMQSKVISPIQEPSFDRTASMPVLEGQSTGRAWRQTGSSSFSTASSSRGSSPSSQESLQTGCFPSQEHRGVWDKVHILQSPSKEQAQLSCLASVKTGWLPIQRRVMVVGNTGSQNQYMDTSSGQVKLKQPITPAIQKNKEMHFYKAEAERSHTSPSVPCVKTRITLDRGSAFNKGPENSPAKEGNQAVGWPSMTTGWKPNRVSGHLGGNDSNEICRGLREEPRLMTTTSTQSVNHSPLHRRASADPAGHYSLLQGANAVKTQKPHTPLQRTSSVQPLKATVFYGTNSSSESSHIQTSSPVTTLIPQNKAGFSSITISSKKVSRSASLPGSRSMKSLSPSPPDQQSMDPDSRQVRVQRKATIVKVTEQRVVSNGSPSTGRPGTPPSGNALDTVVRRRKATIIKVTEHKETYSTDKIRNPEHRHSYTEGLYKNNSTLNSKVPPYLLNSSPSAVTTPNTPNAKKNETLHRSTLNFFLSNPPAIASPPLEPAPGAAGQRSRRLQRPMSSYGSLIVHSDQSKESDEQSSYWRQSSRPSQETSPNHMHFNHLPISSGKSVKEAGQPMAADTLTPNRDEIDSTPSADGRRRASPSLTLIKAPDPDSHQSQEEVLALNAAAIIANIKLQRQLSQKKKTPRGSERGSPASPQGNAVMDEGKYINGNKGEARYHRQPHAEFIPLGPNLERSAECASLQRALKRFRPEFISRSQERVQALERKVQERRERSGAGRLELRGDQLRQLRANSSTGPTSLNGNLFRPTDRGISQRDVQSRSKRRVAAPAVP